MTIDTPAPVAPPARSAPLGRRLAQVPPVVSVALLLVIVLAIFSLTTRGFGTYANATAIIATSCVLMIAALGQLVVVITGGFDLSIGGVLPLSAVIYATMTTAGESGWTAAGVAFAVAAVVGLVHTVAIITFGINPLIATLATLSITGGTAYTIANGQTLSVPSEAGALGDSILPRIPLYVLVTIVLIIVLHVVLRNTIYGRRLYMIGGNLEAARLAGVRTTPIAGSAYVISALLAALAGIVTASQLLAATGGVGADTTLQSLTAVVLGGAALTGGRGTVLGAVVGVAILGVIANGLTLLHVPSFYQDIITGAMLLLAVGLSRLQEANRTRV